MAKFKELLDRNRLTLYVLIISVTFMLFLVGQEKPRVSIRTINESQLTEMEKVARENRDLKSRLAKLEPATPVKMVASDSAIANRSTFSPLTVMEDGRPVPFEIVYEDPSWVRPDYQPYWHSIKGQWSNIPDRIHNSYHRLFISQGTPVLWNETLHNSGIAELAGDIKLPVFGNKTSETIAIVCANHLVTDIFVFGNQVTLVGTPSRTGVQVLAADIRELIGSTSGEIMALNNNKKSNK